MKRPYGDARGFDAVMASVRLAPWLCRSSDQILSVRPDKGVAIPATPEELIDGKYFGSFEEFAAANGLGEAGARQATSKWLRHRLAGRVMVAALLYLAMLNKRRRRR